MKLHIYSGEQWEQVRETVVKVRYGSQLADLTLIVVRGDAQTLLSKNRIKAIRLQWQDILQTAQINDIKAKGC